MGLESCNKQISYLPRFSSQFGNIFAIVCSLAVLQNEKHTLISLRWTLFITSNHLLDFFCLCFCVFFSIRSHPQYTEIVSDAIELKLLQTLFCPLFTQSVSCWISSKPRFAIPSSSNSPYKCGTHVFRKRYSSSMRFFGMLNQNSGRSLFLPYDITTLLGNGIDLPTGLPMRSRKYSGGSAHARAGRGINSKIRNEPNERTQLWIKKFDITANYRTTIESRPSNTTHFDDCFTTNHHKTAVENRLLWKWVRMSTVKLY